MEGRDVQKFWTLGFSRLDSYLREPTNKEQDMTAKTATEVEGYFDALPEEARTTMTELRQIIRSAAPDAEEVISYQIPTFKQNGFLVALGAAKSHCGFYVMSESVLDRFREELKPLKTAPTTVRFPFGKPLPSDLIVKIVQARIQENTGSEKNKQEKRK